MANRSREDHNNFNSNRNFRGKTQKQHYIPRSNPTSTTPHSTALQSPINNTKFSSSLRQSQPSNSSSSSSSPFASSSSSSSKGHIHGSRVQLGKDGEWVSSNSNSYGGGGKFVNYLPQDEAVAVGLGVEEGGLDPLESQRVVDLVNRELAKLLKLEPRDFWRQVAVDESLHEFIDSFLQFRSRWYDFPYHGAKGIVAGVIVGDLELSRRVFMFLYRILSNKDPGSSVAMSLSQKDHQALLQEKKLLDLPKLLDICAVYGHENGDLTRSLVWNAINVQPDIHGRFTLMLSHFLGLIHTLYERCTSKLEALISAGGGEDNGSSQRHIEYLEVMDFVNDAVVSMDAFVSAYRPAAVHFSCPIDSSHGSQELVNVLATLHDSLLPALRQGLQIILAAESKSSMLSDVYVSLRILSSRLVDLGWKLIDNCYLSEELFKDNFPFPASMKMFPASVEDPIIRADILVQTLKEIAAVPQHVQGKHHRGTFLQNIERNYQILHKIKSLKQSGWVFMEDEHYQYLTEMMTFPLPDTSRKLPGAPNSARDDNLQIEDVAIVESKISQVMDIFPDYGKGFISACLEIYDNNPEEVIQRILEGTLHEDLKRLDTSLETVPPKPSPSMNKKDKGKGILIESTEVPSKSIPQKSQHEPVSSSESLVSSSVGRFVRKSNQPDHETLGLRDKKNVERTAALSLQYEYEDEYDDSFDDLGMTIVESGLEEAEILRERISSKLAISSGPETQSSGLNPGASKWNSKKKPQFFVKDGKNYSYKVEGSIAVSDQKQAHLVNQAQKGLIHGLGRGGNRPLGAVNMLEEQNEAERNESEPTEVEGNGGRGRGRGRRGGGRHNHYRKDRALKKHVIGLGGF